MVDHTRFVVVVPVPVSYYYYLLLLLLRLPPQLLQVTLLSQRGRAMLRVCQ